METLVKTNELSHDEWLAARNAGIGGSDIGAIAGLNKWKSPIKVYMEKVEGLSEDLSDNETVYWGNALENLVAQEFSKRTGLKTRRRNAILKHPEHEWALANVDRLIVANDDRGPGVLEVKTANAFALKDWEGDEIPASYLVQLQWYLFVTGYKWGAFAALIGGQKFVVKEVERDDELIDHLYNIASKFWNEHVIPKIPPEIDGSNSSSLLLSALYPMAEPDSEIQLENDAERYIDALNQIKIEIDELDTKKKEYENKLKVMLGENEKGITPNYTVTWKSVSSKRIDSKLLKKEQPEIYTKYIKESSSRRFQIK